MLYLFRLRETIRPATPNPINASEPGSGTAATLPPLSPGGLFLQAGKFGFWYLAKQVVLNGVLG